MLDGVLLGSFEKGIGFVVSYSSPEWAYGFDGDSQISRTLLSPWPSEHMACWGLQHGGVWREKALEELIILPKTMVEPNWIFRDGRKTAALLKFQPLSPCGHGRKIAIIGDRGTQNAGWQLHF